LHILIGLYVKKIILKGYNNKDKFKINCGVINMLSDRHIMDGQFKCSSTYKIMSVSCLAIPGYYFDFYMVIHNNKLYLGEDIC